MERFKIKNENNQLCKSMQRLCYWNAEEISEHCRQNSVLTNDLFDQFIRSLLFEQRKYGMNEQ